MAITSSAALGAAVPLAGAQAGSASLESPVPVSEATPYSSEELFDNGPQRTFSSDTATQIAMPLGGIGAGCICLNGYGGLQDFSIWNHPSTTALPEGYSSSQAAFAILHIKGASPVTKLVEGPFPVLKIFDQGLQGEGYRRGGFEGFPRFQKVRLQGRVSLRRSEAHATQRFRCRSRSAHGILLFRSTTRTQEYLAPSSNTRFTTAHRERVEYEFSYHLSHLGARMQRGTIGKPQYRDS